MTQHDYILRIAEDIGRVLAQVLFHQQKQDYQGAHAFIDEQFRQILGMGAGFIHSAPEETLLAMLSSFGHLDIERCWLLATLLKADGEVFEAQDNENESYYSYLKALDLYLTALVGDGELRPLDAVPEVEGLLYKLSAFELPNRTKKLLFSYFEQTGSFSNAEDMLFELLESAPDDATLMTQGRDFYLRLLRLNDAKLAMANFSRDGAEDGLVKLMQMDNRT